MDKLWAPWRAKFIMSKKRGRCIFCHADTSFIIRKSKFSFAMLNIYPYNNGHIMVSPYRHVRDLTGLNNSELLDLIKTTRDVQQLLEEKLHPDGFNIGVNIGDAGGAGYKHLHIHIVPRWRGDTNFMPIIYETKIISQSLKEMHNLLTGKPYAKTQRHRRQRR